MQRREFSKNLLYVTVFGAFGGSLFGQKDNISTTLSEKEKNKKIEKVKGLTREDLDEFRLDLVAASAVLEYQKMAEKINILSKQSKIDLKDMKDALWSFRYLKRSADAILQLDKEEAYKDYDKMLEVKKHYDNMYKEYVFHYEVLKKYAPTHVSEAELQKWAPDEALKFLKEIVDDLLTRTKEKKVQQEKKNRKQAETLQSLIPRIKSTTYATQQRKSIRSFGPVHPFLGTRTESLRWIENEKGKEKTNLMAYFSVVLENGETLYCTVIEDDHRIYYKRPGENADDIATYIPCPYLEITGKTKRKSK